MEPLSTWEQILLGVIAVLVLLWFRPGIKRAFERSSEAKAKDWMGALIPLGLVVLFVIVLIAMARA